MNFKWGLYIFQFCLFPFNPAQTEFYVMTSAVYSATHFQLLFREIFTMLSTDWNLSLCTLLLDINLLSFFLRDCLPSLSCTECTQCRCKQTGANSTTALKDESFADIGLIELWRTNRYSAPRDLESWNCHDTFPLISSCRIIKCGYMINLPSL